MRRATSGDRPSISTAKVAERVLIFGPPGSGKTTRARELGYELLEREQFRTDAAFKRVVMRLAREDELDLAVVRCCFTPRELREWEQITLPSEVIRLDTDVETCKRRLYERRNPGWKGEVVAAERWFASWAGGQVQTARKRPKRRTKMSTHALGYDRKHQNERKRWVEFFEKGGSVHCPRCRRPITAGMAWHLDHAPGKRGHLGPSHAHCNVVAGGKLGAAITNYKKRRRVSRAW